MAGFKFDLTCSSVFHWQWGSDLWQQMCHKDESNIIHINYILIRYVIMIFSDILKEIDSFSHFPSTEGKVVHSSGYP